MELLNKRRVGTLALGLVMSFGLVACGGDAAPTATSVPKAAPTNTTAAAAPTNTTAAAAPTATMAAAEPTATTGSTGGTGSTGSMTGPGAELEAAAKGMKDVKSYHLDVMSDMGGTSTTMGADVDVANKNLRITTATGGVNSTILVVGDKAWMSADGGKTYTADPTNGAMGQAIQPFLTMWDSSPMTSGTPAPEGAIKAGSPAQETIDGTQTDHWIIDSAAMSGGAGGAGGSIEMWVTTGANPTIRQMKTSTTAAGATSTTTIKWSKFGEDFGITAPATP